MKLLHFEFLGAPKFDARGGSKYSKCNNFSLMVTGQPSEMDILLTVKLRVQGLWPGFCHELFNISSQ